MELSTATRCENCRELIEQKNNTIEFQQNKLINYQDLLVKAQRDLIDTKNELLRIKAKYSIGFRIYDNSDGEDGSSSFDYLAATATITTNSDKIFDNFPDYNSVSDESRIHRVKRRCITVIGIGIGIMEAVRKYKLFLGNVVRPVTALVLKKYLESSFGPVIEVQQDGSLPYAIVNFADSISYYKAVNSGKLSIGDVIVRIEEIRLRH
ncbi:19087_t:CDS:2 [Entrophospora sp. SA101]|nr:13128_t:CDS:2 [Entrophospora sp. SA101]CAJ0747221.1 19087_t:CDS:2 [Entrophospora sp. SA101]